MPLAPTPRPRGPKAVKMDAQVLLQAAETVFARDGLQAASLRAIAKEAGCDPALIYYHFKNKEAVLAAIMGARLPPLLQDLRRVADPGDGRPTAEKLWEVQQTFHRHCVLSQGFRSTVRGEIAKGAPGIQALLLEHVTPAQLAIRAVFTEGMRRGELRTGLDPALLTFFMVRMEFELLDLIPAMSVPLLGLPAAGALELAERTWFETFWRGIAAHPDAPLTFLPSPPERP